MPVAKQQHDRDSGESADIRLLQADIGYFPALLSESVCNVLTAALLKTDGLAWRCNEIRMFGRHVRQPRLTVWVADPQITYRYSGITMLPVPWNAVLNDVRSKVEHAAGCCFNSVLINQYRNGQDYMGWHRDDEHELGTEPVIASLSLGATRYFDLRHRDYRSNKLAVQRFELQSGDLIIMRGTTQQHWQHRVPKQSRVTGPRLNLSFRMTLPDQR